MANRQTIQLILPKTIPTDIFTDSLTSLFLLSTEIHGPTSHFNKNLLHNIIQLAQQATSPIHLRKVRSHIGIIGNEQADMLANMGTELPLPPELDMDIHTTPPYWLATFSTPIRNITTHLKEVSNKHTLQIPPRSTNMFPNG